MDVYKVKIYPAAKRDLQQIVDYLNTLSAQAALRYYDLLVEQISSLSHMPFRCPRPRDAALAAKGYRYLLVEKYLVFYVVVGAPQSSGPAAASSWWNVTRARSRSAAMASRSMPRSCACRGHVTTAAAGAIG